MLTQKRPLLLCCSLRTSRILGFGLLGFLVLDSGFQSPGFRIPQAKKFWIPESGFPYMGRIKQNELNCRDTAPFNIDFNCLTYLWYLQGYVLNLQTTFIWREMELSGVIIDRFRSVLLEFVVACFYPLRLTAVFKDSREQFWPQAVQAHYMNADVTLACERWSVTNGYLQRLVWD